MVRVRSLYRTDAALVSDAAIQYEMARLDSEATSPSDREQLRRALARRYRHDVVAGTEGEVVFAGSQLLAFALRSDAVNPLSGYRERHLVDLVVCSHDGFDHLESLLDLERALARNERIDIMRCEIDCRAPNFASALRALETVGFIPHHVTLRKCLEPRLPSDGNFCRTSQTHASFALNCLRVSMRRGMLAAGVIVDDVVLDRYLARRYKQLNSKTRLSYVALGPDSEPNAHCLVEILPSSLPERSEAAIVDLHVDHHKIGEGWSWRLRSYVEQDLRRVGIRSVGATVVQVNMTNSQDVMNSAASRGWWAVRQSMAAPVVRGFGLDQPLTYAEADW